MYRITNQLILASVLADDAGDRIVGQSRFSKQLFDALEQDLQCYRGWTDQTHRNDREAQVDTALTEAWLSINSRRLLYVSAKGLKSLFRNADFVETKDRKPCRDAEQKTPNQCLRVARPSFVDPSVLQAIHVNADTGPAEQLYPAYQMLLLSSQWWPLWDIYCRSGNPRAGTFARWYLGCAKKQNNLSGHFPDWHKSPPWMTRQTVTGKKRQDLPGMLQEKIYGEYLIAAICPEKRDSFEIWLDALTAGNLTPCTLVNSLVFGPLSIMAQSASHSTRYPKCASALNTLLTHLHGPESVAGAHYERIKPPEPDLQAIDDLKSALKLFISPEDLISSKAPASEQPVCPDMIKSSGLYRWLNRLSYPFSKIKNPPALEAVIRNVIPEVYTRDTEIRKPDRSNNIPQKVYLDGLKTKVNSLSRQTPSRNRLREAFARVISALSQGESLWSIAGSLRSIMPAPMDLKDQYENRIHERLTEWRDWLDPENANNDSTARADDPTPEWEMPTGFGDGKEEKAEKLLPLITETMEFLQQAVPSDADRRLSDVCSGDIEVIIRQAFFTCMLEDLTSWAVEVKKEYDGNDQE
jgi:hypothetical protein